MANTILHWYRDCPAWIRPHDGMTKKQLRRLEKRPHDETMRHEIINCATCKSRGPESTEDARFTAQPAEKE